MVVTQTNRPDKKKNSFFFYLTIYFRQFACLRKRGKHNVSCILFILSALILDFQIWWFHVGFHFSRIDGTTWELFLVQFSFEVFFYFKNSSRFHEPNYRLWILMDYFSRCAPVRKNLFKNFSLLSSLKKL